MVMTFIGFVMDRARQHAEQKDGLLLLRTKNLFPLVLFSFAIVVPVSYRHRGPQEKAKEIDTCYVRHTKGQRSAGLTLLQNVDDLRMTETKEVLSCGGKLIASKITNNTTAHHGCEFPVGSS